MGFFSRQEYNFMGLVKLKKMKEHQAAPRAGSGGIFGLGGFFSPGMAGISCLFWLPSQRGVGHLPCGKAGQPWPQTVSPGGALPDLLTGLTLPQLLAAPSCPPCTQGAVRQWVCDQGRWP